MSTDDNITIRSRYALNYKGIPIKTEWVELPDFEALYQNLGLVATSQKSDGTPRYTLPVIYDPNTSQTISESMAIARYLDKTYPDTPLLFPRGTHAFHAVFAEKGDWLYHSLFNVVCYATWSRMNERSQVVYRATREAVFGRKLEEVLTHKDWEEAEKAFDVVDQWLRANLQEGEGRDELVMGDTICFADIVIASALVWLKVTLGSDSKGWARIMSWNEGKWGRIVTRFAKYEVIDGEVVSLVLWSFQVGDRKSHTPIC